jgi:hypothetical protein
MSLYHYYFAPSSYLQPRFGSCCRGHSSFCCSRSPPSNCWQCRQRSPPLSSVEPHSGTRNRSGHRPSVSSEGTGDSFTLQEEPSVKHKRGRSVSFTLPEADAREILRRDDPPKGLAVTRPGSPRRTDELPKVLGVIRTGSPRRTDELPKVLGVIRTGSPRSTEASNYWWSSGSWWNP